VVRDGRGAVVLDGEWGVVDAVGAGGGVFGASGIVVGAAARGSGTAVADPGGACVTPGAGVAEIPPITVVDDGLACGTELTVAAAFVARSVPVSMSMSPSESVPGAAWGSVSVVP
jgi:orotidine-5'-phosphate decarboxylase